MIPYGIQSCKNSTSTRRIIATSRSWFELELSFFSSEKRQKLKKEQEPIERLAFQLIVQRDAALPIATGGLSCEQLSLSSEKYLG